MKVEFRDGERELPEYLADQMAGIDTYTMTVDEAIEIVNERQLQRVVDAAFDEMISNHMRDLELGL